MDASVIIPFFNASSHLARLIDSLAQVDVSEYSVELLFVDNKSTDNSRPLLERAVSSNAFSQFLSSKILEEIKVQSSYAARNHGVFESAGRVLIFTDSDCEVAPDWITSYLRSFLSSGSKLVCGDIISKPGFTMVERYSLHEKMLDPRTVLNSSIGSYAQTANLGVHREVFEKVGLFRPHMTSGGDAEFCLRAQEKLGVELIFEPAIKVYHSHRTALTGLYRQNKRYQEGAYALEYLLNKRLLKRPSLTAVLINFARDFLSCIKRKVVRGDFTETASIRFSICRLVEKLGRRAADTEISESHKRKLLLIPKISSLVNRR